MPGIVIVAGEVPDYTLGKLNQGEAEKGPLWVGGPGHVGGAGLAAAGTAGVIGSYIAGGCHTCRSCGGGALDALRSKLVQCNTGVGAVSPVDGIGQLIAERGKVSVRGVVLRPGIILLVYCSVQAVAVELGGVALGPANAYGLLGLPHDQRVTASHSLSLEQGQLFRHGIGGGDDILKPGQPGAELLAGIPVIGYTGQNTRQVDQNAVLVHPADAVQGTAGPAVILDIADFDPVAAIVLQKRKGCAGGNGGDFRTAALGLVNGERLVTAVPGGGAGDVQLEVASGCIGVGFLSGEDCGREYANRHNDSQQAGNRLFPAGFHAFQHRISSLIRFWVSKRTAQHCAVLKWAGVSFLPVLFIRGMGALCAFYLLFKAILLRCFQCRQCFRDSGSIPPNVGD